MVMFMGAKSSGKTSLVNYLLGLESTPLQLKTGIVLTLHSDHRTTRASSISLGDKWYLLLCFSLTCKTKGLSVTSPHFTVIEYGDAFSQLSPTEVSADFAFSSLQQFGQHFVQEHLQAYRMPLSILQKACSLLFFCSSCSRVSSSLSALFY